MSQSVNLELSDEQQKLLLRGLSYVRRSVMLEVREPSGEVAEDRRRQMKEITALIDQVNGEAGAESGELRAESSPL